MDREVIKLTDEFVKQEGNSCRFCPMGMGRYKIIENNETSYLCEKHYQEYIVNNKKLP